MVEGLGRWWRGSVDGRGFKRATCARQMTYTCASTCPRSHACTASRFISNGITVFRFGDVVAYDLPRRDASGS